MTVRRRPTIVKTSLVKSGTLRRMTAEKKGDRRSKAQKIADELAEQIDSGEIGPGKALPPTRVLCERYEVTRETIRQAVLKLKHAGKVTSTQGGGVYARERPKLKRLGMARYDKVRWRDNDEVAFIADRVDSGRTYERNEQTQTVEKVPAPSEAAEAYGLKPGTEVWARARLVKEGEQPTHTLTSYYLPEHVDGTRLVDPTPGPAGRGGGYRVLYEIGLEPDEMQEDLFSRPPTAAEIERLELPPGEHVVELHRTVWTADGTVVEFAIGVHAESRFVWSYRFKMPDSSLTTDTTKGDGHAQ